MAFQIRKATKQFVRLRAAFIGPAGSGKTFTALSIASGIGARVIVIDTERGSASKYADLFNFEVLELDTFAPDTYCEAIRACEEAGADVIVIDSLSHAWMGKDGALEMVDKAAARSNSRNSFDAWRSVTPQHNRFVDTMLRCKSHLLVTMRSKMEYVIEEDGRGKKVPRKVGLAPVQRDGLEYEFDVVGEMNADHQMVITKSRCAVLADQVFERPGAQVATILRAWMTDAPAATEPQAKPVEPDTLAMFLAEVVALPTADAALSLWSVNRGILGKLPEDQRSKAWGALVKRVATIQHSAPDAATAWLKAEFAVVELRAALAGVDLPGECCALWMKYAPRLTPNLLATAWAETVVRLEAVGKMHRGGVWLRKSLTEECERRGVTVPLPPPDDTPPTGTDSPRSARPATATGDATSTPIESTTAPANSTGATSTFAPRAGASADEVLAAWRLHLAASANAWEAGTSWVKHEPSFAKEIHERALRLTREALAHHGERAPSSLLATIRAKRAKAAVAATACATEREAA